MSKALSYHYRTMMKTNRLLFEKVTICEKKREGRNEPEKPSLNITDSLIYASYIQRALLPSNLSFLELLPDSFVFFKPKEIVSGDFYWIGKNCDKVYIVAADCTGHGVPGAFISMIGIELLNKTILDLKIDKPSDILTNLSKGIHRTFHYGTEEAAILKNGMEMGICSIDRSKQTIEFAGSYHPLYIIRNNNIIKINGDRITVGISGNSNFTNNIFQILEGDVVYMFSDGYVDQFGGPDDKKFMYKRFRQLLLSICGFPKNEQHRILHETIKEWAGKREQVDDILVIGFSI